MKMFAFLLSLAQCEQTLANNTLSTPPLLCEIKVKMYDSSVAVILCTTLET